MALRVINGGQKGSNDPAEEPGGRTKRQDATEVELDDDDDDGLGSSTIIGTPPVPPKARAFGVGSFDVDDDSIDDALNGIEDRASVALPPGPQVASRHFAAPAPAGPQIASRHFPSPSTHGRAQSVADTQPSAPAYPGTGQMPAYPPSHPSQPHMAYPSAPSTGQIPNQFGMTPMPAPTMPAAPPRNNTVLFAVLGAGVVVALGGIIAYTVLAKGDKQPAKVASSGSDQVSAVKAGSSETTTGSAGSATTNGSAGSAGSATVATGSAGSAETGSAAVVPPPTVKLKADFTRVEHPVTGEPISSQVKGQVASVAVTKTRDVKSGETLFTIKSRSGANMDALAKKVSEMEAMAKDDPDTYGPFLSRARSELRSAQAPVMTTLKAPSAGTFQSKVKVGDQVTPGTVLGSFVDSKSWIGVADMEGSPTARWICTVGDNTHTAPCEIQGTEVINEGSGTRVTVTITATGTSWLEGPSTPWLALEPP